MQHGIRSEKPAPSSGAEDNTEQPNTDTENNSGEPANMLQTTMNQNSDIDDYSTIHDKKSTADKGSFLDLASLSMFPP